MSGGHAARFALAAALVVCLGLAACGGDEETAGAGASSGSPPEPTERVAVVPCPFDAGSVAEIVGAPVELIEGPEADTSSQGSRTSCVIGVPGGSYPVDAEQPWVTVRVDLPEAVRRGRETFDAIAPPQAVLADAPQWGEGAYSQTLEYQPEDDLPEGFEVQAHFVKDDVAYEIDLEAPYAGQEDAATRLDELVGLVP